jgi:hypothetical protein
MDISGLLDSLLLCPNIEIISAPTRIGSDERIKEQQIPPLRRRSRSGSGRNDNGLFGEALEAPSYFRMSLAG